jgi:uncharacterized membrane protein
MAEPVTLGAAERMKFFTDAVVAIAMTLLILPLLESVAEAARHDASTAEYLGDHLDQLFAFVLSFLIIGRFWITHERLFGYVERWTGPLMTLNQLWMLGIVFLPVSTALVGSMHTDRVQLSVYIGSMLACSLLMLAMQVHVRRTPAVWSGPEGPPTQRIESAGIFVVLLAVALLLALVVPGLGFFALFALFLSTPLHAWVARRRQ